MTLFGYDDANQCWIIKNSAGTDWGEDGWLRMDYDSAMFAEWYGEGTGIMYIDGIYGNIQPDVPKVIIDTPTIFHSYVFGIEYAQIFRNIPNIQKGAPRIIGSVPVRIKADNTEYVEFYLDSTLQYRDDEEPFEWTLDAEAGLHTIEVFAYKGTALSKAIIDVFIIS
jgi:hypothetical protein